jgi:hypothetical protein
MLLIAIFTTACATDPENVADDPADVHSGCGKVVNVWFEPTSGMDAITNDNGCWNARNLVSGADGYGWCSEINGTLQVKHNPDDVTSWFFDDTNPVRTVALDTSQIRACHAAMAKPVPGIEVMARRPDPVTGAAHWQKIVLSDSSGQWIVNHWIAELHASAFDVASYYGAWHADEGIGVPQVNARNEGAQCDARVSAAVLEVCRAVKNGGTISIVKNDGRLEYTGGCLTHVVEALNACTK